MIMLNVSHKLASANHVKNKVMMLYYKSAI
jgi:hypothetical protein